LSEYHPVKAHLEQDAWAQASAGVWQACQALLDLQHDVLFASQTSACFGTFCKQHIHYCQSLECTMASCITSAQIFL